MLLHVMPLPARRQSKEISTSAEYRALVDDVAQKASAARDQAARAVNTELVLLYWDIGRTILAEQERHAWGDDVVGLLAQDLRSRSDLGRGFSRRNLFYMRRFAATWPSVEIVQTLSAQIGWSHHQVLLDALADTPDLYAWYVAKTIEHHWSVRELKGQIDLKLHLRYGAATANYAAALGEVEGHAALAVLADDIPDALRAELAGLPEIRDQLTSHVADTAQRVEARQFERGENVDERG